MNTPTIEEPEVIPITVRGPLRMSYEEYLEWEHEGGLTEWVDGEIIVHMPPKSEHQRVVLFLAGLLLNFLRVYDTGKVLVAPFTMRVVAGGAAREPDLFFLASEHLERLTRRELVGPADLVVEVVSDDSVARDRDEKFHEYQAAGVPEYWIIDPRPNRHRADFYVLDEQGQYQPVPVQADNIYRSRVLPQFWLRVNWLWQDNPNPLATLAEIVGTERVIAALQSSE